MKEGMRPRKRRKKSKQSRLGRKKSEIKLYNYATEN
jgi:hypothetical protein